MVVLSRLWSPANVVSPALWNLTAVEDQQLAGLVMWVPAGLIYGGAAQPVAGVRRETKIA